MGLPARPVQPEEITIHYPGEIELSVDWKKVRVHTDTVRDFPDVTGLPPEIEVDVTVGPIKILDAKTVKKLEREEREQFEKKVAEFKKTIRPNPNYPDVTGSLPDLEFSVGKITFVR